ncbi:MAG: hypothetical protein ACR652_16935 [Methylocystis sp.]|uniref:hypothetical protein n=1 Tax=Methylocystis sp. TaxID=1911079 RepID=UPI003DA5453D
MTAGDEASVISFHRLHYGKLAAGEDRRVTPSSGYAITRRSAGLDPAWDNFLSPPRLAGLRRFEPDAIDIDARAAGCFLARTVGEGVVFMRARFRPEDGERGAGRLHQQAAMWLCGLDAWTRNPAACLSIAAHELHATPDLVSEAEAARMNDAPLRWRAARPDPEAVRRVVGRARWAVPMMETLLDGVEWGRQTVCEFGAHDFATEAEFLSAVGFALQMLPQNFPSWRDISIVSGLATPLQGLCLRYTPSWSRAQAAA